MFLIEDSIIPDVYVSGIGRIENLSNGMVRIVYYAERQIEPGSVEWVVVAKMIRPAATLFDFLQMFHEAKSKAALPPAVLRLPVPVH